MVLFLSLSFRGLGIGSNLLQSGPPCACACSTVSGQSAGGAAGGGFCSGAYLQLKLENKSPPLPLSNPSALPPLRPCAPLHIRTHLHTQSCPPLPTQHVPQPPTSCNPCRSSAL
jgi:hypothetical protein